MKNRLFLLFVSLFACGALQAAEKGGEEIDEATRKRIAEMFTYNVNEEVKAGRISIKAVESSKKKVEIYTSVGMSYYPFREDRVEMLYDSVRELLPEEYRKAEIEIYTEKREIKEYIPMAYRSKAAIAKMKKKERPLPFTNGSARPLVTSLDRLSKPTKGLSGRHIALWQSHGRFFDPSRNGWRWQRSQLWMTCEDLYTQSYVLPYLVPMLENAGANVMMPRERDVQLNEVLADNDHEGEYREEQGAEPWGEGGAGFAHRRDVYHVGENPFRDGTSRSAYTVTDPAVVSRAVWSARIPERGEYAVYVSYESSIQSADDATYTVNHLGGSSNYAVNQTMGGGTWIYLGTFLFDEGEQEVVSLTNLSRLAGRTVSADGVKIGGGYGNISRSTDPSLRKEGTEYIEEVSGYPRFCEAARYWLQWAGFGEKVYNSAANLDDYKDDIRARAHWVNALMGGSKRLPDSAGLRVPVDMVLAFHSDAGLRNGDEVVGTLGIYNTKDNRSRFTANIDRIRSRDLTDIVMTQIVSDIRRTYEPEWMRRAMWDRAYYEARVPWAPTMLLELLSHQNFADMRYGHDPRFKFLVSRAVYKGVLQFVASQYKVDYVVQPLPVASPSVEFVAIDRVKVAWSPVIDSLEASAAPDGYIVYTRIDDGGFDAGRYTERTSMEIDQQRGHLYSYRITAVNEGGESFPSETVSACRVDNERGVMLIVNGFDRVSAPASSRCDSLAGFYCDADAGVPDRRDISFIGKQKVYDLSKAQENNDRKALGASETFYESDVLTGNTFDYPALHGRSAVAAGYSFCSASAHALTEGRVAADGYGVLDLVLGEQRATVMGRGTSGVHFKAFPKHLQRVLRDYTARGGALFVSGSYVATDLWDTQYSDADDRAFAREVLHIERERGNAAERGRVRVVTGRGGFTRGDYTFNNDDYLDTSTYVAESPDAIKGVNGGFAVMRYIENGRTAAVAADGAARTFVMGFPFETISDEGRRDRLMRDAVDFLTDMDNAQ